MVRQEIEKATYLYQKYGRDILEDPDIIPLVTRYKEEIKESHFIMREAGVAAACSSCAGVITSGCCFGGVEEWYDCNLLLINLLLDKPLPLETDLPDSCLFVGENGCQLIARHSFCVNFICPDLLKGFTQTQKAVLSKAIGFELQAGWELEKSLRNWLTQGIRSPR